LYWMAKKVQASHINVRQMHEAMLQTFEGIQSRRNDT